MVELLRTAALVDDHLGQVALDDFLIFLEVDQRHAAELDRGTARLQPAQPVHFAVLLHHVAVIGLKLVGRPGSAAVTTTIVGVVTVRSDDPVVPAQLAEVYVEALLAALARGGSGTVNRPSAHTFRTDCRRWIGEHDKERPMVIVVTVVIIVVSRSRLLLRIEGRMMAAWWWLVKMVGMMMMMRMMMMVMMILDYGPRFK